MRYWASSDTHYGHGAIIQYSNRPFKNSDEMNKEMIRRFNERVKPEDHTFFLGDFVFKSGEGCLKAEHWIKQLNGTFTWVRGNHDNNNSLKTIIDCVHITFAHQRINLVHKPEHSNPTFPINLVGHVHTAWKIRYFKQHYKIVEDIVAKGEGVNSDRKDFKDFLERNYEHRLSNSILLNVGVDQNKFYPITLDEAVGQIIRFKKGVKE